MNNRIARIRTGELVTPGSPLNCGLPQVSYVSPILFILYIKPLLNLSNPKGIFGYADDIAFLKTRKTLLQCAGKLQKDFEMIREWVNRMLLHLIQEKASCNISLKLPNPKTILRSDMKIGI